MNTPQNGATATPEQAPDMPSAPDMLTSEQAQMIRQFQQLVTDAGSPELLFAKVYNRLPDQKQKDEFMSQLQQVAPLLGIRIPKMKTARTAHAGASRSRYKV